MLCLYQIYRVGRGGVDTLVGTTGDVILVGPEFVYVFETDIDSGPTKPKITSPVVGTTGQWFSRLTPSTHIVPVVIVGVKMK